MLTGVSAVAMINSELSGQTPIVEGYLRGESLTSFVRRQLLSADDNGNVIIYESHTSAGFEGRYAPDAVIAADLARSAATRERSAGLAGLEEMRQRWLAKHTR